MITFLCILLFIAMGVAGGMIFSRKYKQSSLLANLIAGIIGAIGLAWVMKLLGVGAGFTGLSLWGILFGIAGACLAPWACCLVQEKLSTR